MNLFMIYQNKKKNKTWRTNLGILLMETELTGVSVSARTVSRLFTYHPEEREEGRRESTIRVCHIK